MVDEVVGGRGWAAGPWYAIDARTIALRSRPPRRVGAQSDRLWEMGMPTYRRGDFPFELHVNLLSAHTGEAETLDWNVVE